VARRNSTDGGRGNFSPTANGTLPRYSIRPLSVATLASVSPLDQTLRELEDRRYYQPDRSVRAPASLKRGHAKIATHITEKNLRRVAFANPRYVAMCVRRKIRREVLHALKVAGGKGMRKPRRNYWSDVSC